jgi:hypothetical protein
MLSAVAIGTVMLAAVALMTLVRHQPSSTNTSRASPGAGLPGSSSSCTTMTQQQQQQRQQGQQGQQKTNGCLWMEACKRAGLPGSSSSCTTMTQQQQGQQGQQKTQWLIVDGGM